MMEHPFRRMVVSEAPFLAYSIIQCIIETGAKNRVSFERAGVVFRVTSGGGGRQRGGPLTANHRWTLDKKGGYSSYTQLANYTLRVS